MVTILSAIFVIGVLVFFHELGHFMVAKWAGIRVERFSLGYPPILLRKKWGETEYCLSAIPLGGYVKMAGEDPTQDELIGREDEFLSKPSWIRAAVIAAGPMMNFILAVCLFWIILMVEGRTIISTTRIEVSEPAQGLAKVWDLKNGDSLIAVGNRSISNWDELILALSTDAVVNQLITVIRDSRQITLTAENDLIETMKEGDIGITPMMNTIIDQVESQSPAEKAGLKAGDRIVEVGNILTTTFADLKAQISPYAKDTLLLVYNRHGEICTTQVVPQSREMPQADGSIKTIGVIGIMGQLPFIQKSLGIFEGFQQSLQQCVNALAQMMQFLKMLLGGEISAKHMGGPIYIAQLSGKMAQAGWQSLFSFMALISLNLGLLNLLPIPALDGGHIFIILVETIIQRQLTLKQRQVIQYIGLGFIIMLSLFVIFNDLLRIMS